jgi:phosphoglycerol transferase MdoB-like AlkP superfamily enzyme
LLPYYGIQTVALALGVFLCIIGIRGGIGHNVRPITISNASAYVSKPIDAALVLNTPFALIRTIGKKPFQVTRYFSDQNSLEQVFTPVHRPEIDSIDSTSFRPLNVVVFIMESFGQEYTDEGYTPFLDSLTNHALSFTQSFANGRKSIDAMPSILSSIPYMVEPFILTPASLNKLSGLADNLNHKGYYTAFFHGADNGSMGFDAFARATGFQRYYGRTEYNADPSFGGNADFDGQWAVWDEEFFQFFKKTLDTLPQPFATAMFSASSHHPFRIPEKYQGRFPEGTLPIHVPIAYSDYALRRFFEAAKQEAWYANTLFVITADHTNVQEKPENLNSVGLFRIPVVFYRPDNSLAARREGIAQQIDILPTVLGYLRYDRPYLAFGCDLLNTPSKDTFAFNYVNDIYQYIQNQYVIQFNGQEVTGLYDYIGDPLLKVNLKGTLPQVENEMESRLKAFIQQYMERMTEDRLTVE